MQTEIKELPKSEVQVTITLTPEELAKYEEMAVRRISEQVDIPGFRKGQAPKAFVISHVGTDKFFEETLNFALPHSFYQAVQEKKLAVISRPQIKLISKSPLKYEARAALMPEIKLKEADKIKIPEEPVAVTDEELEQVIYEMRKYRAKYKLLERAVQKGDRVEIDFQGYDEAGAALDKTKSVNHPLFVGEESLVAGFEDELIGMKPGEKKKFKIKFPKDFHHEPLRSKKVEFEVEIKKAEEPILPELNEEFVSDIMGQKKTPDEFRTAVKTDLHNRKVLEARRMRENALLEKLLHEAKFDVPSLLIEEESYYMLEDLRRELGHRNLKFETYLQQAKKDEKGLLKEYTPEAEKRVRIRLILNYLFRTLNISATEEEIKAAGIKLLESIPEKERAKLQEQLDKKGELYLRLQNNLMLEKLFVRFLGK